MKKIYEESKLEVIALTVQDVLTFSQENNKDDVGDDIFGTNN